MQLSRRLTDHFLPNHYNLSLTINRMERRFEGVVTIHGAMQSNGSLWVHAKDLEITNAVVDGKTVECSAGTDDELEIKVQSITGTKHVVVLNYSGQITDQMHGIYPCYFEHEGEKKELIATQFESHHAREAFPCIDEPAAKATYDVTLTTEQNVTVLGNMPVSLQRVENDKLVTTFDTTPKMSSYLLAWVIGELHKKTATTVSGVEVNIWATPAQPAASLDFALEIATRTIDFFDEYFGVPYPLPKCDHVALPDFSSGAMENWGLITYREVALLAEPGSVSVSSKHRIAAVIAHELSHQWFGNLVTMKWWNNLWLNESFANLMEYIAIDAIKPEWNVWFDFAGYETVMSLRRDATDGVQAVQVDVHHPDEISTLFDPAIVYAKGSRLLHMLERAIGREAFRDGLRTYFERHAYENTSEADLWSALSQSSGMDVGAFMTPWISQPGYPVVHVDADGLRQNQFFIGDHTEAGRTWPIPLGAADSQLPKIITEISLSQPTADSTRLNQDDSAHFITHYSSDRMDAHLATVRSGALDPIGRLQLLHEQTLLARGRVIESAALVPLLDVYRDETTENVWDIIAVTVGELKKFVEDDAESEAALRSLAENLAAPQFERLGWTAELGEPETDTKLRATIIGMMTYGETPDVLLHARTLAATDPVSIDPELRALVLGSAIRHGVGDDLFDSLLDLHRTTSSAELQQDIASGLTSTKSQPQIDRLLELLTDPQTIRSQDVARWFVYLIRNRYSRAKTWQWVQTNWQWIESTFAGDKSFDDYPRYAATGLSTAEQLNEYITFFEPLKSQKSLTRVIEMGMSEIKARVDLIESDAPAVRTTLLNKK
ncbi:MAG: M1 family metallopeptidase [Patescibacteria group bacterium]